MHEPSLVKNKTNKNCDIFDSLWFWSDHCTASFVGLLHPSSTSTEMLIYIILSNPINWRGFERVDLPLLVSTFPRFLPSL